MSRLMLGRCPGLEGTGLGGFHICSHLSGLPGAYKAGRGRADI